jgi:tripartite-type tricarboxylate transporter receptor subunit TctC
MKTLAALLIALICALLHTSAVAQSDWPSKPVRIVVGFPAGITDNLARVLAKVLTQQTGQSFYIENKPGAGTTIAAAEVARAPADGHTLLMQDMSSHAINATLYKQLPYDSIRDFTTVTLVASTPLVMVVNPSVSARSVQELVAMLKSQPGVHNFGSSGIGTTTHLAGELLQLRTGTKMMHVPYKGAAAATQAMLGGEVAVTFTTMPTAVPLAKAGKVRPIAVTTVRRAASLPDVPTMQEAGVGGYELVIYNGVLAPAKLPPGITAKVREHVFKALDAPEVKAFYSSVSADIVTSTSTEEFAAQLAADIDRLGAMVRSAGVQAN